MCKVRLRCHAMQWRVCHATQLCAAQRGQCIALPARLPSLPTCSCMYARRMEMPLRTCCSASGPSSSWPRYLQAARQAGQVCGGKGQVSEWWRLRRVVQTAEAVKQWRESVCGRQVWVRACRVACRGGLSLSEVYCVSPGGRCPAVGNRTMFWVQSSSASLPSAPQMQQPHGGHSNSGSGSAATDPYAGAGSQAGRLRWGSHELLEALLGLQLHRAAQHGHRLLGGAALCQEGAVAVKVLEVLQKQTGGRQGGGKEE